MNENGIVEPVGSELIVPQTYVSKLEHRLRIYVPSFDSNGLIPEKIRIQALRRCRSTIEQLCGGATEWHAVGSYVGDTGVVREPVILLTAHFCGGDSIVEELFVVCRWLRDQLKQECLATEVDSTLYLV